MSSEVVVSGRLKPDGTVELDDAPRLPAGKVEIVLRPLSIAGPTGEDWWQYLQRVRREAEAAGGPFKSQAAIDAEREEFRGADELCAFP